jgi:DNA-binding transcriptional LysR family regulator
MPARHDRTRGGEAGLTGIAGVTAAGGTALGGVDANLLVALDALLSTRSVTAAAGRVGMGQPGMSHALSRLRAHFDDPLLVRSGRRMVLTPRAQALAAPVRDVVERMARVFAPPVPFDPATARRRFRIIATDHVGFLLLPGLAARVAAEAPGIDLDVRPIADDSAAEQIAAGEADCAVGVFPALPAAFFQERLLVERFCCVVRADHPAIGKRLTPALYAALPHLLIAPRGTAIGAVDAALAEHGLSRRVAITVPHFLLAPVIAASTDCVVTMSERLAKRLGGLAAVRLLPPPIELPAYAVVMIWHEKDHADDAHRWLRASLSAVGAAVRRELP